MFGFITNAKGELSAHNLLVDKERGTKVGHTRGQKLKSLGYQSRSDSEVFWMSLEEAKRAIADKYEFLADRYETRLPKNKHI